MSERRMIPRDTLQIGDTIRIEIGVDTAVEGVVDDFTSHSVELRGITPGAWWTLDEQVILLDRPEPKPPAKGNARAAYEAFRVHLPITAGRLKDRHFDANTTAWQAIADAALTTERTP